MALNPNPKIRDANHFLEGTTIFNDLDIIVFPNPSNGSRITIKGSIDKLNSLVELSVLDVNGKLIESTNDKVSSYMYEKSWNFKSTLNQGIYLLNIKVDDNIIIDRMGGRRIHPASGRTYHVKFNPPKKSDIDDITGEKLIIRIDDQEDTVKKRLKVYHSTTKPLINFYQSKGIINFINGETEIDEVNKNILHIIDSKK